MPAKTYPTRHHWRPARKPSVRPLIRDATPANIRALLDRLDEVPYERVSDGTETAGAVASRSQDRKKLIILGAFRR